MPKKHQAPEGRWTRATGHGSASLSLSLFGSPRIDRRGPAQAQNILQQLGAGEQPGLAARRSYHLQADRQAGCGEAAWQ